MSQNEILNKIRNDLHGVQFTDLLDVMQAAKAVCHDVLISPHVDHICGLFVRVSNGKWVAR